MRHFDLTPLYRSTIGFDRLGSLLDTLGAFEGETPSYPPYNIERVGENEYRISMAVAGFGESDLAIEVKENTLSIRGEKQAEVEHGTYLHRGIAGRSFERRFQLADHVVVKGASLENGLLHVDLVRELPEAKKPRTIPIATKSDTAQSHRQQGCLGVSALLHGSKRAPSANRRRPFSAPASLRPREIEARRLQL